jgi:formate hydrogenlyase subunit 3/multisubunit Na+/H+ antiporter MnhD subunit
LGPIILSLFCLPFKRAAGWLALVLSLGFLALAGVIFTSGGLASPFLSLQSGHLSSGLNLAAAFFTFLIVLYSLKFMEERERLGEYYCYMLITLGAAAGVFFATDFITLLLFWGILAVTLYLMIGLGGPRASSAAKKTFILVGGADALMILGIGLVIMHTGWAQIGVIKVALDGPFPIIAFLCLLAGVAAKAGALPLHTWIPDSAEVAPLPVLALLPGSLDKLLGIYLLTRLCLDVFILEPNSALSIFLLGLGSATIIVGVMAALIQHDLKKLLSFHAVSQVGYMILGLGTGIPVAIAGSLFHMLNNAVFKNLLFLTAGSVEKQTGTTDLDHLGGLARLMPITSAAALVGALSISGVPPFNGFFSKWMIYQGLVELQKLSPYWVFWLISAMFGSALTLASFIKVLHAVFLGQPSANAQKAREVSWEMWVPMVSLALLCAVFGIFAYQVPLRYFILPVIPIVLTGAWSPDVATILLLWGLLIGMLFYGLGRIRNFKIKPAYVGGEALDEAIVKSSGTDFYDTIREYGLLPVAYGIAERKLLDVYEQGSRFVFWLSGGLRWLHSGLLHTYLAWMFLGIIILLYVLMR